MHMIRSALAGLLALLTATAAVAQTFPTVPGQSLIGRLGATGDTGPSQAIPFARVLAGLSGAQSANRVWAGPTSGGAAPPTWRALVGADLPNPAASSLGGVQSKTCSSSNWLNVLSTGGVLGCAQPAFSDISGSIAASQLPNPSSTTLGGVKSLAAVANNFLTSIGTNGTPTQAQPTCANVSDASVYCSATRGQLPGTTTNDSATAGNVGEIISSTVVSGSAVALTTATPANVTSISLTAGDWDVTAMIGFTGAATTTVTVQLGSLSTTSATQDLTDGRSVSQAYNGFAVYNNALTRSAVGPARFSLSGTTTVFLVAQSTFAVSTSGAFGIIRARRMR